MQNVDFLKLFRTYLSSSKKHSFLSRITKNVFFCFFFAQKKHMRKRSIFWQKPWTNPLAKCRFFPTVWELHFWGRKKFIFYAEYQKMFHSCFLLKKKEFIRKRSIFWQKPWTNPFAKCRFFFYFARTSLFRSKKHSLLSRILKNVSFWLFLLKKTYKQKVDFLTKTMD